MHAGDSKSSFIPEEKHLEMEKAGKGVLAPLQEILRALAAEEAHSLRAILSPSSTALLLLLVLTLGGSKAGRDRGDEVL